MASNDLDVMLQETENQLRLVRFAMMQTLGNAQMCEGVADTTSAAYKLDGESVGVLNGCGDVLWSLCDRIHETLSVY